MWGAHEHPISTPDLQMVQPRQNRLSAIGT